ncbi:50S ribosomal protein L22 [Patescibacteria group bacterium]|nr:50S ribosomal protein L22 [Patescibacteria group bacterium]MBU1867881.1 50S ribosomal protein L22 [Patescibacteria group bacterium]
MTKKQTIATAKYIRQSPRKIRALANLVKDYSLKETLKFLSLSIKKAARPLEKAIRSAIANAEHNLGIDQDNLRIKELQIGPGPTTRRLNIRARGKRDIIRKRSAHIRVILEEIVAGKKVGKGKIAKKTDRPEGTDKKGKEKTSKNDDKKGVRKASREKKSKDK